MSAMLTGIFGLFDFLIRRQPPRLSGPACPARRLIGAMAAAAAYAAQGKKKVTKYFATATVPPWLTEFWMATPFASFAAICLVIKRNRHQHRQADVKLLHPCEPPKILAVGLITKVTSGDRKPPEHPEIFYKPITSLQHPEENIVIPPAAKNVHYEGELVLIIGKRADAGHRMKPGMPFSASPAVTMSANETGKAVPRKICSGGAPKARIPSRRSARLSCMAWITEICSYRRASMATWCRSSTPRT